MLIQRLLIIINVQHLKKVHLNKIYRNRNINEAMQEAAQFQMPSALRKLFVMILLFGEPNNIQSLWNNYFDTMSENFARKGIPKIIFELMLFFFK